MHGRKNIKLSGTVSQGVKQQGGTDDQSPPSNTKAKNVWRYTSTPPDAFMACCLLILRGNFVFTLTLSRKLPIYMILLYQMGFRKYTELLEQIAAHTTVGETLWMTEQLLVWQCSRTEYNANLGSSLLSHQGLFLAHRSMIWSALTLVLPRTALITSN